MLGAGCDERVAQDVEATFRSGNVNTPRLQGPPLVINGPGLGVQGPGLGIQGPWLQIVGVNFFNGPGLGIQGPGLGIQGVSLEGSVLTAVVTKDGVEYPFSGTELIGTEFQLRLEVVVDGQQTIEMVYLRVDNVVQSDQQDDVYLYHMTYRPADSDTWLPYCGEGGVGAIPFKGVWNQSTGDRMDDPNLFTFGCANAALGKCALWGYRPWATATRCKDGNKLNKDNVKKCEIISLQDHHQACTRMARADYCGDGNPRTVDGTLIDIWDTLTPEIQSPFTDWPVEAEWTPEGASCMNFARHPELGYPSCFLDKKGKPMKFNDCGSNKKQRSELINAFDKPSPQ